MDRRVLLLALVLLLAAGALLGLVFLDPAPSGGEPGGEGVAGGGLRRPRDRAEVPLPAPPAPDAAPPAPPEPALPADEGPPVPPPGRGVLELHVRGPGTNQWPLCDVEVLHPTGETVARGRTGERGLLLLRGLPHRVPLVVRLAAAGHLTGILGHVELEMDGKQSREVVLRPGPVALIRVVVAPYGETPSAHAMVELLDGDRVVTSVPLDEAGEARLVGHRHGLHRFRIRGKGYATTPLEEIRLSADGPVTRLDRSLYVGGTLTVRVAGGGPGPEGAAGGSVLVSGAGCPDRTVLLDPASGEAVLEHVVPDCPLDILVIATDGRIGVAASRARDRHDVTVSVVLGPPPPVTGVVTDPEGATVEGARVEMGGRTVRTDHAGRFEIEGVLPGSHAITVTREGFLPHSVGETGDDGVRVDPRSGARLAVHLRRGGRATVHGRVADLSGLPVPGARVRLLPSGLRSVTDDEGRYSIRRVPAEVQQTLVCTAPGWRQVSGGPTESTTFTTIDREEREILVAMAAADGVDEMAAGGADGPRVVTVSGLVEQADRIPAAGVRVWVSGQEAYSDDEGRFRVPDVPLSPGAAELLVQFAPPPGLMLPRRHRVPAPAAGDRVVVGIVRLETRPMLRIDVSSVRARDGRESWPLFAFFAESPVRDGFLGGDRPAGVPLPCATYDGQWLHLPDEPLERELPVILVRPTPRGHLAAGAFWGGDPGARNVDRPRFPEADAILRVEVGDAYDGGTLTLTQTAVDLSRAQMRKAEDEERRLLAALGDPPSFSIRVDERIERVEDLAPGVWRVVLRPRTGGTEPVRELTTPVRGKNRISFLSR